MKQPLTDALEEISERHVHVSSEYLMKHPKHARRCRLHGPRYNGSVAQRATVSRRHRRNVVITLAEHA